MQEMLCEKQKVYRKRMKLDSKRRANWIAAIGMSVNGRDPKRKKSEINKLESKSSNTAALFMYPGVIMSFVGGDGAAVKWGEKGGPNKETRRRLERLQWCIIILATYAHV